MSKKSRGLYLDLSYDEILKMSTGDDSLFIMKKYDISEIAFGKKPESNTFNGKKEDIEILKNIKKTKTENKLFKFFRSTIRNHLVRDKQKNEKTILLENIKTYVDYHLELSYKNKFKYMYLIDDINKKNVIDLTPEDINKLKYLIDVFSTVCYLVPNNELVNRELFTMEYISELYTHKDRQNIYIKNLSYFDYFNYGRTREEIIEYYKENENNENVKLVYKYCIVLDESVNPDASDKYLTNKIRGITREEVIEKYKLYKNTDIFDSDLVIQEYIDQLPINKIKSPEDIDKIKLLSPDSNYVLTYKICTDTYIINTRYIEIAKSINTNYAFELYNKNKICYRCSREMIFDTDTFPSIDAKLALRGHTYDNIVIMCRRCNIIKNHYYDGAYVDKPYYYNIDELDGELLRKIMEYHKLEIIDDIESMREMLKEYIST